MKRGYICLGYNNAKKKFMVAKYNYQDFEEYLKILGLWLPEGVSKKKKKKKKEDRGLMRSSPYDDDIRIRWMAQGHYSGWDFEINRQRRPDDDKIYD